MTTYEKLEVLARQFPLGTPITHVIGGARTIGRVTGFTWAKEQAFVNYVGGKGHHPAMALPSELTDASQRDLDAMGWSQAGAPPKLHGKGR